LAYGDIGFKNTGAASLEDPNYGGGSLLAMAMYPVWLALTAFTGKNFLGNFSAKGGAPISRVNAMGKLGKQGTDVQVLFTLGKILSSQVEEDM
jgi:hypothetical protein